MLKINKEFSTVDPVEKQMDLLVRILATQRATATLVVNSLKLSKTQADKVYEEFEDDISLERDDIYNRYASFWEQFKNGSDYPGSGSSGHYVGLVNDNEGSPIYLNLKVFNRLITEDRINDLIKIKANMSNDVEYFVVDENKKIFPLEFDSERDVLSINYKN